MSKSRGRSDIGLWGGADVALARRQGSLLKALGELHAGQGQFSAGAEGDAPAEVLLSRYHAYLLVGIIVREGGDDHALVPMLPVDWRGNRVVGRQLQAVDCPQDLQQRCTLSKRPACHLLQYQQPCRQLNCAEQQQRPWTAMSMRHACAVLQDICMQLSGHRS